MTSKNYYEILNISTTATESEIKARFKYLANKWHPDKNLDNLELATEVFKTIKEAYDVLADTEKRTEYDREFSKNTDVHIDESGKSYIVSVSLKDAYLGSTIQINQYTQLRLPKGVRSGTKISFKGMTFKVEVLPDDMYKRANDELLVNVNINAIEAMLGTTILINHFDTEVLSCVIPEGCQPGSVIRIPGKGMKSPVYKMNGDVLVKVNVIIPKVKDKELIDIFRRCSYRDTIKMDG